MNLQIVLDLELFIYNSRRKVKQNSIFVVSFRNIFLYIFRTNFVLIWKKTTVIIPMEK